MRVFDWILETSWQASVAAILILGAQALFGKRISPKWRYQLWFILMARLILPSLPESPTSIFNLAKVKPPEVQVSGPAPVYQRLPDTSPSLPSVPADPIQTTKTPLPSQPPPPAYSFPWKSFALWTWATGFCLMMLRLGWTNIRFSQTTRSMEPLQEPGLLELLQECKQRLNVTAAVMLLESDRVETPCLYGMFTKRLLLPRNFIQQFTPVELRHVFLHEAAHLRRRDVEVNWVVAILQSIHWFNPIVWFAFARMRHDREMATDALALGVIDNRAAEEYGETILKVLAGFSKPSGIPQLVGVVEGKSWIKARLRNIARHGRIRSYAFLSCCAAILLACFTLTNAVQERPNAPALRTGKASEPEINEPGARRTVDFAVVASETGAALEGIRIILSTTDTKGNSETTKIVTGAEGRVSFDFPSKGLTLLSGRFLSPERVTKTFTWRHQEIAEIPTILKVALNKALEVGGQVLNSNGRPIEGAAIWMGASPEFALADPNGASVPEAVIQLASTDKDGRWSARLNNVGRAFRVTHPDFAAEILYISPEDAKDPNHPGQFTSRESLLKKQAHLVLRPGLPLRGRVLTLAGSPLARVPVLYTEFRLGQPPSPARFDPSTLVTDDKGGFLIPHLPAKRIYFTVQARGYAPQMAEYNPGTPPEMEIRLKDGLPLEGGVRDSDGKGISDVKVRFKDWGVWQSVRWETLTDSDGKFSWNEAPDSNFALELTKAGFFPKQEILKGGEIKEMRLMRAIRVFGAVRDAETKHLLPSFRIFWSDLSPYGGVISFTNGSYVIDSESLRSFGTISGYPFGLKFRVEAPGYQPQSTRFFDPKAEEGNVRLDFALTRNAVTGRVLDHNRQPVAGAELALKLPGQPLIVDGKGRLRAGARVIETSGADGRFQMSGDTEARFLVVAHEKGFKLVEAPNKQVEIELQPWGRKGKGVGPNYMILFEVRLLWPCVGARVPPPRYEVMNRSTVIGVNRSLSGRPRRELSVNCLEPGLRQNRREDFRADCLRPNSPAWIF